MMTSWPSIAMNGSGPESAKVVLNDLAFRGAAVVGAEQKRPSSSPSDQRRNGADIAPWCHWQVIMLVCGAWALAFALQELPDGRVSVRGVPQLPMPQVCASRSLFGIKCPGCGLTRSIIHLAEGNWYQSWRCHRLGSLIAIVITLQIPYRLNALYARGRPVVGPWWQAALGYALITLLLVNWILDVVTGRVLAV